MSTSGMYVLTVAINESYLAEHRCFILAAVRTVYIFSRGGTIVFEVGGTKISFSVCLCILYLCERAYVILFFLFNFYHVW
jgi:hypothetical protein